MQTFLPFASMKESLMSLDKLRLNKQILEATQILDTLENGSRWENHPAVKMWEGFEPGLVRYYNVGLKIWERRNGGGDRRPYPVPAHIILPWWWGFEPLHESHRSNLLRKDYRFYRSKFKGTLLDLFYLWPLSASGTYCRFYITLPDWVTEDDIEYNRLYHKHLVNFPGASMEPHPQSRRKKVGDTRYDTKYVLEFPRSPAGVINYNRCIYNGNT